MTLALTTDTIQADDPKHWAILFTRARKRKGWSCVRLATEAGIAERSVIRICSTGRCSSTTALKLALALGVTIALPDPPRLTGQAHYGR
jgi:ribosome-binding protein aMBF1 (putative translation factor)